jgi:alkanesulfonate monooxygenase SsuD/methylene tetrahydromethanopterin reductase-like flavin-dependent oxidoreductase (luciferase family)
MRPCEGVSVHFGIFVLAPQFPGESHGDALDRACEVAITAEEAGFDSVWVAEHHFMSYGVCPSAVTFASYLLGATRSITIGTAISVLSTQHPVALAEQAALLDQLSRGRFQLGVGRGGPWIDLEVFGTGLERYERDFAESLDVLVQGVRNGRVSGAGPAFRFRDVEVVPRPWSASGPGIVVACTSPGSRQLAADRGLPMLLGLDLDDAGKAEFIAGYEAAGGTPGAGHVGAAVAHVADTTAEAVAVLEKEMPRWLEPGLAGYRPVDDRPRRRRDPHEYARTLAAMHPVGSPEECSAKLAASIERTGLGHYIFMVEGTGDRARTLETVRRLGTEVLPPIRNDHAG